MVKRKLWIAFFSISSVFLSCCSSSPKPSLTPYVGQAPLKKPLVKHGANRLVFMVFDAMRPDFIDRFDLQNFKKLRSISRNYQNSYLGYIGAETSVSHLVFPTGKRPRELPVQDDIYLDQDGKLSTPQTFYATGGLAISQLRTLMESLPKDESLPANLKKDFGGTAFAIGEKNYATTELGTLSADSIVTLKKEKGYCSPDGVNVPTYIVSNERYQLECSKKYGTDKSFYPLDGAKSVPGDDLHHLGGDIWVADAAIDVMNHENWSSLSLTFSGIDKVMHMLGEVDPTYTPSQDEGISTEYHLEKVAKIADEQLGRVLNTLKEKGLLDQTLIVVTADHGCQVDKKYLGNGKTSKWGVLKNESAKDAPGWVTHFTKAGDVLFSYQDTAIRTWMKTRDSNRSEVIHAMGEVPGVTEIYALQNKKGVWSYRRVFSALSKQPLRFQNWAKKHSKEILDATATSASPDLIGLLADETGFDLIGDHGGAQENVQRIPLMISGPLIAAKTVRKPIRAFEVKEEVLRQIMQPK